MLKNLVTIATVYINVVYKYFSFPILNIKHKIANN